MVILSVHDFKNAAFQLILKLDVSGSKLQKKKQKTVLLLFEICHFF